jgi:2-polyprenyl-3-methyl-5-hydroxy-6-metoxy-1,4-benzoquinol methylase
MEESSQPDHDRALAVAFDGQAARFEHAPVQTDPQALAWLVRFADLPADSLILDAGCGPGLVSRVFLNDGNRVVGVDLSAQMVERARLRCPDPGRATFLQGSIYELDPGGPFDASVSRYVLHHVADPTRFIRRQVELLRPGGVLVLSDHTTDPAPNVAAWHNGIEVSRDKTHTSNLTAGTIVDLFAAAGLIDVRLVEESFTLDFDEWFDRGTPTAPKAEVRARLEAGPSARGFAARPASEGRLEISGWRMIVRGVKP